MTSQPALSATTSARLESLRGLAAVQVAIFHSLLVLEAMPNDCRFLPALVAFFNGSAAVTLFFVLSGFVLGLSLRRQSGGFLRDYAAYAIRRIFRIYPALIVATLCVIILLVCTAWFRTPTPSLW